MEQKFREKGRERGKNVERKDYRSKKEGRKEMTWITAKYPFILVTWYLSQDFLCIFPIVVIILSHPIHFIERRRRRRMRKPERERKLRFTVCCLSFNPIICRWNGQFAWRHTCNEKGGEKGERRHAFGSRPHSFPAKLWRGRKEGGKVVYAAITMVRKERKETNIRE